MFLHAQRSGCERNYFYIAVVLHGQPNVLTNITTFGTQNFLKRSFLAKFLCPASNNSHIWATELYKLTPKMEYLGNIYEIIGLSWTTKRSTPKFADPKFPFPQFFKGPLPKKKIAPTPSVSQTLHLRPKPRGKRSELRLGRHRKGTSYNPKSCYTSENQHVIPLNDAIFWIRRYMFKKTPIIFGIYLCWFFWGGNISPLKPGRFSQTGLEKS